MQMQMQIDEISSDSGSGSGGGRGAAMAVMHALRKIYEIIVGRTRGYSLHACNTRCNARSSLAYLNLLHSTSTGRRTKWMEVEGRTKGLDTREDQLRIWPSSQVERKGCLGVRQMQPRWDGDGAHSSALVADFFGLRALLLELLQAGLHLLAREVRDGQPLHDVPVPVRDLYVTWSIYIPGPIFKCT